MIDLSEIVQDPDFAQVFLINRSGGGNFVRGVFTENAATIPAYGVISVATSDDLLQLAEADRVSGTMVFHSASPIYETSESRESTSDILIWRGENYRVSKVFQYQDYGFWKAYAVRTSGA